MTTTPIAPPEPVFLGIDVAKATLDVAAYPGPAPVRVTNDAAGITHLLARSRFVNPRQHAEQAVVKHL